MKFFKIIISILCLASIIPFTACSDESPFEVVEDDLANASDDVYYDQKSSKCYNGVDEYNSWCCEHFEEKCYVRYSSSSSMPAKSASWIAARVFSKGCRPSSFRSQYQLGCIQAWSIPRSFQYLYLGAI